MCVLTNEIKTTCVLCNPFAVLVRMKYTCMYELRKYELCDFGDSTCKLNAIIFVSETGTARCKTVKVMLII